MFNQTAYQPIYMSAGIDCSWCKVDLIIENIGSSVIHDYMVSLTFNSAKPFEVDDDFGGKAKTGSAIVVGSALERYVDINEALNSVEYRPKQNRLVQKDCSPFSFYIKPKEEEQEIQINWEVKSANYSKSGVLVIESKYSYFKRYGDQKKWDPDDIYIEPVIREF